MKSKRHIIFLIMLLLTSIIANATIVQKLLLKDGSELEGYISMQRPGMNFNFSAKRALVYMLGENTKIIDSDINVKQLSPAWIEWAEKNDAFVGLGDNRTLTLSDIITDSKTITKVRILEKGAKIKYLDMNDNTYSLNWDTIAVVKVGKRSKTNLTGINRIYKLDDGREYVGQYVEEVPGKTLSLYRENGIVEVLETDKVVKYSMQKVNPNQDLFEQSQLLDIIHLKNNTILKGIIIEQNFSEKSVSDNYLLIKDNDNTTHSVKLEDILEYKKEINPRYSPIYDILLQVGDLVINRQQPNLMNIKEQDGYIILPNDTCLVEIKKDASATAITIETNFPADMSSQSLEVVKIKKYISKKKKKNSFLGFTFEDLVKNSIQPSKIEKSVNNTTKIVYSIVSDGLYGVYNPQKKIVIPFRIN